MKKIKFFTSLTALTTVVATTTIVTTSCSDNKNKETYKLQSVEWLSTPQVKKITWVYDFKITKDGKEISNDLVASCTNNNSSAELGVNTTYATMIEPTKAGTWDYNVKATIYKDSKKQETEIVSLSTKVIVTEEVKPEPNIYKLESVKWSKTPEKTITSEVTDFVILKNGIECPKTLIKSYVNDGSDTELGVDNTNPLKITPTSSGVFKYKLKVTFYKDDNNIETEDANLSISVNVNEYQQKLTSIISNEDVTIPYVIATEETQSSDVVGKLGVKLLDQNGNEIPQTGKTITYTINLDDKPDWLIDCFINNDGDVFLQIDPSKVTENIDVFSTTWQASCEGIDSYSQPLSLCCTPKLEQNGMIVCDDPYTSYHAIGLPENIQRDTITQLAKVSDQGTITFTDVTGTSQTISVDSIIYLSIVNVDTTTPDKNVYMLYSDFCRGWENLYYVNLSGLVDTEIIGSYAFEGCTNLMEINMTGANKLRLFYDGVLSNCPSLQSVDFSDVCKTSSRLIIHPNVLSGCTSLKKINLSGFKDNTLIYDGFAYNCPNLEEINIGSQDPTKWSLTYGKDYIIANIDPNCQAVTNGIKIVGNNAEAFKTVLPEDTTAGSITLRHYQ